MIRRGTLILLLTWCALTSAQMVGTEELVKTAFPIPDRYHLINDFNGALRIAKAVEINGRLQALEKRNGTQIVFLSVPSTGPQGTYAYATKVFEKWNLGNNGQNNGVLFLVSEDGAVILTGAGVGGALPDVTVSRIFREILEPHWKRGDYSDGVAAALDAMIKAATPEDTAPTFFDYVHPMVPTKLEHWLIGGLLVFGAGYVAFAWRTRQRRG